MGNFALQVKAFSEKAQGNADLVVRKIALEMLTRIVMRSPVGNPELWAANAHAVRVNTSIAEYNARLRANPKNRDKRGRLKRGIAMKGIQGGESVAKLTLPAGQGYVGGALRGSWTTSLGAPAASPTDRIDPSGREAIAAGKAVIDNVKAGEAVIYISSNLPYVYRIEFEGHSKQAPAGMVRVTVAEFANVVQQAVSEVPK